MQVITAYTTLDIAAARAKHACWLSAVQPDFLQQSQGCVHLEAAFHPLLLQRKLAPLPAIPGLDDPDDSYDQDSSGSRAGPSAVDETQQRESREWKLQPVDFSVPARARVAAVTGPNTGVRQRMI